MDYGINVALISASRGSRHRGIRKLRVACLALAGVFATVGPLARPASAAVPGLVRITTTSVSDSADSKSATAVCPSGKNVIGMGGEITGGLGEVVIDDLRPNGLASVTVTAYEADPPYDPTWSVTAYAVCSDPVPGLVRIQSSTTGSLTQQHAVAACPTGKVVLGVGGEITGGLGEVSFSAIRPSGSASAMVIAHEVDGPYAPNWTITAYALCANPLPGMEWISRSPGGGGDSADFKGVSAPCPAGKSLIAPAVQVGGSGEVVIDDLRPTGTGVSVTGYEEDPYSGIWDITAMALCATP